MEQVGQLSPCSVLGLGSENAEAALLPHLPAEAPTQSHLSLEWTAQKAAGRHAGTHWIKEQEASSFQGREAAGGSLQAFLEKV